jgi:hypothetical protein
MSKVELWGTFAVADHRRKRPFVAEVLMYDRLIVPQPASPEEEPPLPGEPNEVRRWSRRGWKPHKLGIILDYLGDLAIPVTWTRAMREDWQRRVGKARADRRARARLEVANVAREAIDGSALTRAGLNAVASGHLYNAEFRRRAALVKPTEPNSSVETVVAYGSREDLNMQLPIRKAGEKNSQEPPSYGIFEWQFFMPENEDPSERGDISTLIQAAELARRSDFREMRQHFHGFLRNMHQGQVPSADAKKQMQKLLSEYQAILESQWQHKVARYATKIAPILAPIADLKVPGLGVILGIAAKGAALHVEENLRPPLVDPRLLPAAMVHTVRRFFEATR